MHRTMVLINDKRSEDRTRKSMSSTEIENPSLTSNHHIAKNLSKALNCLCHCRFAVNYISTIIGTLVISLLAFFIVPSGVALECSDGWYVTGYFTPDESNYSGEKVEVAVTNPQGETGDREFYKAFIEVVETEGFGKTLAGDYLRGDDNEWHSENGDLDRYGEPLKIGITVAVDPKVVPFGTELTIPSLPKPWSDYNFTATDEGVGGRHIDVFTGEGSKAELETFRITGQNHTVCLN